MAEYEIIDFYPSNWDFQDSPGASIMTGPEVWGSKVILVREQFGIGNGRTYVAEDMEDAKREFETVKKYLKEKHYIVDNFLDSLNEQK